MMEEVKHIDPPKGRVFVVGDIHGYYGKLLTALEEVAFDKDKDLLVAVGDLVDRGPHSFECLNLVREDWFVSCLGNHEDMMFKGLLDESRPHYHCWIENGGGWHWKETFAFGGDEGFLDYLAMKIRPKMHHRIQVGNVGFCHAEPPVVWTKKYLTDHEKRDLLWGRAWVGMDVEIENINHVYVGHTPQKEVITRGDITYMDVGAWLDADKDIVVKDITDEVQEGFYAIKGDHDELVKAAADYVSKKHHKVLEELAKV